MGRLPPLDLAALDPDAQRIFAAISGPRGGITAGPFAIMMQIPEVAERVAALNATIRHTDRITPRVYELVALLVAHHWSAAFIWGAHAKHALAAGIPAATVDALARGEAPAFDADDESAAVALVRALLDRRAVDEETYARALAVFGAPATVEIVTVAAYYSLLAMMVSTFDPAPMDPRSAA